VSTRILKKAADLLSVPANELPSRERLAIWQTEWFFDAKL